MERAGKKIAGGVVVLLAFGLWMAPVCVHGAQKAFSDFEQIEKAVVSASAKAIRYRRGKISTTENRAWKNAKKLSLRAARLNVSKKGRYTFRITLQTGKKKLLWVKLQKKNYEIAANKTVPQKEGYCMLVPKCSVKQAVTVSKSSCADGKKLCLNKSGTVAAGVWELEPAGRKFYLKNANSGLYLGLSDKGKGEEAAAVQKKFQKKDRSIMFEAAGAGGKYFYIKCVKNGFYLNVKDSKIIGGARDGKKEWKFKILRTEKPVSCIKAKKYTYPSSLLQGKSFVLRGTVYSCYAMTSLTASVTDAGGTAVLKKTVKPRADSYELSGIDSAITFGKLPVGDYFYKVKATDRCGSVVTVFNKKFKVYNNTSEPVGTAAGEGAKLLAYDSALIAKVGCQADGTDLEKKACASYALAYCIAILNKKVTSPHTYWVGENNVDCVWSKGGYTTNAYESEAAVLRAACSQIAAGKPCILHVTGSTTSQHWVAVVGYRNTASQSSLTVSDFVALDPWSGTLINVSDKYKANKTYRLACKA